MATGDSHMTADEQEKRVFIAIGFTDEVKDYLASIQQKLKAKCRSGNFTLPENLHLTLRFIGNTGTYGISMLKTAIDEAALSSHAFEIKIGGLGQFPSRGKYTVWAGIRSGRELEELYNRLQTALESAGHQREGRRFTPHITLAREVIPDSLISETLAAGNTNDEISMKVDRVYLMESTRVNGKLKYIPIYSRKLNDSE